MTTSILIGLVFPTLVFFVVGEAVLERLNFLCAPCRLGCPPVSSQDFDLLNQVVSLRSARKRSSCMTTLSSSKSQQVSRACCSASRSCLPAGVGQSFDLRRPPFHRG
jgi:hypothetical protein